MPLVDFRLWVTVVYMTFNTAQRYNSSNIQSDTFLGLPSSGFNVIDKIYA